MSTPGLTNQGFVASSVQEEVTALNDLLLANVDAGLDLDPDQPFGQIVGTYAERFGALNELLGTVYNMLNPAAAEGQLLANIASLSGTFPQVATYSTVGVSLTLAAGASAPAGSVMSVSGQPSNTWVLTATVTNSGGSTAVIAGIAQGATPGPQAANAGTLTVIETPAVGWTAVTNAADATQGLAADTDTTLRQRRAAELSGAGSGDLDAIVAAVLKVENVISAFGFENVTMAGPDVNGVPAKSFRIVVWDGPGMSASNAAIAQAIWSHKPSGIEAFGNTQVTVTDSSGNPQVVGFDRATQLVLYVTLTTTPGTLTTAGTAAVKSSLAAYAAANFGLGTPIIAVPFRCEGVVPNVTTDVPTFAFDFHASPTNTGNLLVTGLQIATLSTSNILVNGM